MAEKNVLSQAPACVAEAGCYEYDGVIMPPFMAAHGIEKIKNMKVRTDDVFLLTYPKTGTTWVSNIALLVKFDGDLAASESKGDVPFLEVVNPGPRDPADTKLPPTRVDTADAMPTDSIRVLKTHVIPSWLPKDIQDDPKVRIIYVARNPKDTAVSYYNFHNYVKLLPTYASWDEFFEEFIAGRAIEGDWFEHTLYWWKLRNHPKVLFLTYEEMKKDSRKAVRQIAEFMGKSLSDDIIQHIDEATSFKAMKSNKNVNPDFKMGNSVDKSNNKSFFRKGAVGDWHNYFTEDQNKRFDELYEKKTAGSGLELEFE